MILPLLGFAAKDFEPFKPFLPYLFAPLIGYFIAKAAISWHVTAGPSIFFGPVEFEESGRMFEVIIKNVGRGEVTAHAYTGEFRDRNGKRIGRIDAAIELHWRGLEPGEKMRLVGEKSGILGLLMLSTPGTEPFTLLLPAPAEPGDPPHSVRQAALLADPISSELQETFLTIRVEFRDDDGKHIIDRSKRLKVVRAMSGTGYHVEWATSGHQTHKQ